ncbi:MAG: glycosyltransferase [Candidatus Hodarchaeota archaeon]
MFSIATWLNLLILPIEGFGLIYGTYLAFMVAGACLQNSQKKLRDQQMIALSTTPKVSILIPVYNTSLMELEETLKETMKLTYSNFEIIIADNSDNEEIRENIKTLAKTFGCQYTYNPNEEGFKAGALNKALKVTTGEYILVLDSDHHPVPNLLENVLPAFSDPDVGFTQVKLLFRDYTRTRYMQSSSLVNIQFHEVFQRSKDLRKAAIFSGSTACFRKSALEDIGGFQEETVTEDVDTSCRLLCHGYRSREIDLFGSIGTVPSSWRNQITQLWRWAHGATSMLKLRKVEIIRGKTSRKVKIELILNALAFLVGIGVMALVVILAGMYWFQIPIFRPSIEILIPDFIYLRFNPLLQGWISQVQNIPLYLATPTFIFLGHLSAATLAIIWGNQHAKTRIHSIWQLPSFYIISLAVHPFLVSAIINAFLGRKATWTADIPMTRNTLLFAVLGVGLGVAGLKALIEFHPLALLFLVLACAYLFPLLYIAERPNSESKEK